MQMFLAGLSKPRGGCGGDAKSDVERQEWYVHEGHPCCDSF